MILLAGIPSEPPLRLAIEAADRLKIPYVIFNQRNAHSYDMSLQYRSQKFYGILQIDGQEYELEKFNGIYIRLMDYHFLPEIKNRVFNYVGHDSADKSIQLQINFLQWLDGAKNCRTVNKPVNMLNNMSKPYQTQLISQCGLLIPPTLITNNQDLVKAYRENHGPLIFKSISSVRSIVKEFDGVSMQDLSKLRYLPTQFQKKLEGTNIRVHVVGDSIYATRIDASVTDYRYSAQEGEESVLSEHELNDVVSECCLKISKRFELPFCGIDLFETIDNRYFCFEVNPSPGYSYYQQSTGQDIASALVRYLEFGN